MRYLSILLFLIAFCSPVAHADSWLPPSVQTTYSPNKMFRFVSTPREIQSRLAYFEAKTAGRELPPGPPAKGRLERAKGATWETVWTNDLVNEVAPVSALVSDDGSRVVTFDNWHSMGLGDHVVVIYGAEGKLIRSLRLDELIPRYFIDALPRSVSSLWWRSGEPVFQVGELRIPIADVDRAIENPAFQISIGLDRGEVSPLSADSFGQVKPRFCAAHRAAVQNFNASLAYQRRDLAPWGADKDETWQRYIYQVINRLGAGPDNDFIDPDGSFDLPVPGEGLRKIGISLFRQALQAKAEEMPVRWLSSRDLGRLTTEIERTAAKLAPGQLAGVELHVMTTKDHWPRIETALSKSGAKVVLADISESIPQRAEILSGLPIDNTVDEACKG